MTSPINYGVVPSGLCSAVRVRCFTSHFERPATLKKARPQISRPGRRQTEKDGDALRVLGEGPFVALPGLERRGHVTAAIEINRERERVHHGAAGALADVRRQRMGRIADHRDLAGRPALELYHLEPVVSPLRPDPCDERARCGNAAFHKAWLTGTDLAPRPDRAWSARYRSRSRCTACRARAGCPTSIRPSWRLRSSASPLASCRSEAGCRRRPGYLRLARRPSRRAASNWRRRRRRSRSALSRLAVRQRQLAFRGRRHGFRIE